MSEPGTLYVVATPIGNLSDLSTRANEILRTVDLVLCEDTRVTKKLLEAIEATVKTESIHQHSTDKKLEAVIEQLATGVNVAYVSDAGTPNVSDPGGKLVALAAENDVDIVTIPGPSAVTAALAVCGFPSDRFTFFGFPPQKKGRSSYFDEIAATEHTVVFFESKHRILKTLAELPEDRAMMVGRELTKLHETLYRGTSKEIQEQLEKGSQKGEFVIVLAPIHWNA